MVKAIMHGCNGKMGQVISGLVKEDDVIEIVAGIDKTSPESRIRTRYLQASQSVMCRQML